MAIRYRNGQPYEEVCPECENTNGEHKPWCHTGKKKRREALEERAREFLKHNRRSRKR